MTSTLKTEKLQFRGDNSDAITLSSATFPVFVITPGFFSKFNISDP